jgi:cytoskeletal protein CcmA (bactofilin family)
MFKKNNTQNTLEISHQEISTIIGEGFTITGEMEGNTSIRIEGKVVGNVNISDGIILGEKGIIEGNVTTKSAIIYGTIEGNIKATQLEIKKTGTVNGDIITDNLEIEMGAQYNGKLNMKKQAVSSLAEAS